jgi:2,3-bisphosphoglycerate-dependent phosphoglycerate mutase
VTPLHIYFVRHGESESNLRREFSNHGWKHPLTPQGVQQAEALADELAGIPCRAIFSSPLQRAVQTAEILAARLGVPVTRTDALREYDVGSWEGRTDPEGWAEYIRVFQEWMVHNRRDVTMGGGECFHDIQARFTPLIAHIAQTYGPGGGAVVCVGHGGLFRCMLPPLLTNLDPAMGLTHHLGNTAVVLTERDGDGWVCRQWGETML